MFTDTHCHISQKDYSDIDLIIKTSENNRINKMINNGTDMKSNKEVLDLSKKYKNLYAALGFHPDSISEFKKEYLQFIEEHINELVAIGEIGLDYHYDNFDKNNQIKLFKMQLEIAKKYNKPVIVHSRDATEDTIKILKEYPTVKGSIHCFSGSLETAKIYIKMGYKLGLGGVVTFKNSKFKECLKEIPLEFILLETDSPYLSPEPIRGTKNEPQNIRYIAKFIAECKGISIEKLAEITEKNVKSIFDI